MIFEQIHDIFELSFSVDFKAVGIFDNIYYLLMYEFLQPISAKFNNVIGTIIPYIRFSWFLFILSYGYFILAGKIQAPAKEFVFRVVVCSIVFWLALSPITYKKFIITPVMELTHLTSNALTPDYKAGSIFDLISTSKRSGDTNESIYNANRDLFSALDVSIESVGIIIASVINTYESTLEVAPPKTGDSGEESQNTAVKTGESPYLTVMLVMGFIGLLVTGSVMVYVTAAIILMINHLLLVILLVVGPLFVVLAVFKSTREYAKKWVSRLAAVILTIGITTAVVSFILAIQGDVSKQICKTTVTLQSEMVKKYNEKVTAINKKEGSNIEKMELKTVKEAVEKALSDLETRAGNSLNSFFQVQSLAQKIKAGCMKGAGGAEDSGNATESGYNILFAAIQFLVICMVLNRVLTESANVAATLVNASGINAGTGQEVSSGVQGISGRVNGSPGAR